MKKTDKHIIIALMIFVMISVSTTSVFFLLGGGVKTSQLSEVNASRIYVTPPNATVITNALDAVGCKDNKGICSASSPKLLFDSQIILFDSNQKQIPTSTYTNIPIQQSLFAPKLDVTGRYGGFSLPKLSLTDTNGNLLDLGTVQYKPFAITNVDTNVIITGQFAVYLDDVMEAHRNIATQGSTVNKTIPLYIDTQPAYTFTFADEGANWADKSVHIFKIVVGNVTATTGIGQNTQTFKETNNVLVYVLVMTVDQEKITSIGVDSKAVAIFKSDDILETCGRNGLIGHYETGTPGYYTQENYFISNSATNTGLVQVYENGFLVASSQSNAVNPSFDPTNGASLAGQPIGLKQCTMAYGIPRDSDLVISVGGQYYNIHTPVTQTTLLYDCSGNVVPKDPLHDATLNNMITGGCTNNFPK